MSDFKRKRRPSEVGAPTQSSGLKDHSEPKAINDFSQGIELSARLALRCDEAAPALGLSPRKVWELTNSGELPHVRVGRAVLYPVASLKAWLEERTRGGKP